MDTPANYHIQFQGVLDPRWTDRLSGFSVRQIDYSKSPPLTLLQGVAQDQAVLAGVLDLIYTLGLPLVSVDRIETEATLFGA
jgi:hypothetical protein